MEIFKQIDPLKACLKNSRQQGKTIGLVPTMGALHEGHLILIKASQAQNQLTVCSIYVNPTQFNNPDDLLKYPRTLDRDIELLRLAGCDVLFYPQTEEMYLEKSVLNIDFGKLGNVMEGYYRPGHFSGVALVVSKLFNIIQPDHAYFGQKDWQQFAIISKLVQELKFNLMLHSIDTLREPDGLAMSSRNQRLDADQRVKATVFYHALLVGKEALKMGEGMASVKEKVKDTVNQQHGVRLEYFEVADSINLNLLESLSMENKPIMCIAGYVGEVRLIDNMFLV